MATEEAVIDPATVEWEFPTELPEGSVEYSAAIGVPSREEQIVDLLYSTLASAYTLQQRMVYFGIMDVHPRGSNEFMAAERDLRKLTSQLPTPDIFGGVIHGTTADGQEAIGVVLFYEKEKVDNEAQSPPTESST